MADANTLNSGECSLTDGSVEGDWHLPNINELSSLIHYAFSNPAISNAAGTGQWSAGDAFTNVQSERYWTSTTSSLPGDAWYIFLGSGLSQTSTKTATRYVIPVRSE